MSNDEDGRVRRAAQRRVKRRQELLKAAQTVFSRKGYHAAAVADILEQAGASRGTFYLYFPSKRAVFEALLDEMFEHISNAVWRVKTGSDTAPVVDQMHENVCRLLDVFEQHRDLTVILLREAVALDVELDQKLALFWERICQLIDGALVLGQSLGIIRECDTEMVARFVLGGMKEWALYWLLSDGDAAKRDRVAREILAYSIRGVFVDAE